jgi:hypothetical protein
MMEREILYFVDGEHSNETTVVAFGPFNWRMIDINPELYTNRCHARASKSQQQ